MGMQGMPVMPGAPHMPVMPAGTPGGMQQTSATSPRAPSPREALLGELRKAPPGPETVRITPMADMRQTAVVTGDVKETTAVTDDMKIAAAAPYQAQKGAVTVEELKRTSATTQDGVDRTALTSDEMKRISATREEVKKTPASPEDARTSTISAERQAVADGYVMEETSRVKYESMSEIEQKETSAKAQKEKSGSPSGSGGRLNALAELRKSRTESVKELSSPESYSAVSVEYSSTQRQRVVTAEVSPERQRAAQVEEGYYQPEARTECAQEEMYRGYGGGYGGADIEAAGPVMIERDQAMAPGFQQDYATSEVHRAIEGMDIDMQQAVGAAYEFEDLQNMIEGLRLKIDIIEDQNREMKRMKEEEALANEEKMAEKERLIDRLTAGMAQSSDKMGDVQHTVKMLSEKVYEVIEIVKEIGKIQDEMAEEGRKNLSSVEEQMREVFKELRKFSMLEEIQLLVEDVKHSKAERSEMLDAMDRKADKSQLDCKLDKTMFETLCEEFNHGFNDLMVKISALEQHLERAVQDINVVLEQKLERKEMDQYRDHMKGRLKAIVTKLKQMKEIIEEDPDAAGIKIRCLSCDRPLKKPERNFVVSDGSLNPLLPKHMPNMPSDSAFLPPLSGDGTFRAAGGWHTLTTPPLSIRTTAGAGMSVDKIWEEVPLQGTDGRVYHGYLEKTARKASA